MPTYRLDLAYDGTRFRGFARQPGQRTVQGEVEQAIARTLGVEVSTTAAGRTDAGVHARQQVISFATEEGFDVERLLRSLAGQLASEISPLSLTRAADTFDARFSARWRAYRYQILNQKAGDPLLRDQVWHIPTPLDVAAIDKGAQGLVGEHDFASFCRADSSGGTVRRVLQAECRVETGLTLIEIRANAFCHQMVRSIVGLLVDVGLGKRSDVGAVLAARDRSRVPNLAPARGLLLWEVGYDQQQ